jgi:dienelactone hydrolase
MMRSWHVAVVLIAVVAWSAGAQVSDNGAFLMRTATDTISLERFNRVADTVRGSVALRGQPRQDFTATLGSQFTIRALALDLFRDGATDAAPLQRIRVTMIDDSAIVFVNDAPQRIKTTRGAILLMNNSFALAEQLTRRARAGTGTVEIPAWALTGGMTVPVLVRPVGADSMVISIGSVEERFRVDAVGRILGGLIPSQHIEIMRIDAAAAATLKLGRVDYSAPAGAPYTAREVTLTGPHGITLGGTLTIPSGSRGRVPAVVTITGSGQEDRDEYIPVGGGYRPFRQIADTLGRRGVAVLRLDDRMVGMSGGELGTSADYADDIRAAIAFLRTQPEIDPDRIALLGHSEGGMIAPMVAATDSRLRGIVLMAGPAYRGGDIIRYQARNGIESNPTIKASVRDSLVRVSMASFDSIARVNPWMDFFYRYDPLPTARKVKVPVLILQGATDHQVTPEQAQLLATAIRGGGNNNVTVRVFPDLNHLFVLDPSGQPAGYTGLKSARVTPEVLGLIADWLVKTLGVR